MAPYPKSISGFFLGGVIPKERVGDILEMLYLSGATDLTIDPRSDRVPPKRLTASAPEGAPAPALPPPAHANKPLKYFLLDLIAQKKPDRATITQEARAAGYNIQQLGGRLFELRAKNKLIKVVNGRYEPVGSIPHRGPNGKAVRQGSHAETILSLLGEAGAPVALAKLRSQFADRGHRGESVSVALNALMSSGQVRRPAPATYELVPTTSKD